LDGDLASAGSGVDGTGNLRGVGVRHLLLLTLLRGRSGFGGFGLRSGGLWRVGPGPRWPVGSPWLGDRRSGRRGPDGDGRGSKGSRLARWIGRAPGRCVARARGFSVTRVLAAERLVNLGQRLLLGVGEIGVVSDRDSDALTVRQIEEPGPEVHHRGRYPKR